MPYCEPHHSARDRIIDLEVMRLELRRTARPPAPRHDGERGTVVPFPLGRGSTPPPRAA
jgi:hypothetical protein